jgi:hypothetical protein
MQVYYNGPIEAYIIRNENTGEELEIISNFEEAEYHLEKCKTEHPYLTWHIYARIT